MTTIWSSSVYTQEPSILKVSYFAANSDHIVITSNIGLLEYRARFETANMTSLEIDMSDLVRLYRIGSFDVTEYDSTNTELSQSGNIPWSHAGLIAPTHVLAPKSALADTVGMALMIMPPSMMIKSPFNIVRTNYEMYGYDGQWFSTGRALYLPSFQMERFRRIMTIPNNTDAIELWHLNDEKYFTIQLQEPDCERRYAAVEWVSYTGIARLHIFEVVKVTTETTETVSIETIDRQYDVLKNRVDSLTLRLEGLDVYDYWYYADVITSSNIRITLDGVNWYKVQVTTKKYTLPESNAGKANTLEIAVNYRRYDTV